MLPTLPLPGDAPAKRDRTQGGMSWANSNSLGAAYVLAVVSLVAVQVGSGVLLKAVQHDGRYAFSPSGSVAISECIKVLISLALFYHECRRRAARGTPPRTRSRSPTYTALNSGDNESPSSPLDPNDGAEDAATTPSRPPFHLDMTMFWGYIRGEVPTGAQYGFANLALFYMLINNIIFVCYELADPATIQLLRGGMTFITAFISMVLLQAGISKVQWAAIVFQLCGLVVTQYHPDTGSAYPFYVYLVIMLQVTLGACAGVYNQYLLKSHTSSLHAANLQLAACSVLVNFVAHIVLWIFRADEPSFFSGYKSIGAVLVVANNAVLGLVISAVYKYADAVIKCFAGAISTAILMYISAAFFGTTLGFIAVPGMLILFTASWLYIHESGSSLASQAKSIGDQVEPDLKGPELLHWLYTLRPAVQMAMTSIFSLAAVASIVLLTLAVDMTLLSKETTSGNHTVTTISLPPFDSTLENSFHHHINDWGTGSDKQALSDDGTNHGTEDEPQQESIEGSQESPFKRTAVVFRWNTGNLRGPNSTAAEDYAAFFHTVHVSIPGSLPGQLTEFYNETLDQFPTTDTAYVQVARLMQFLLDEDRAVSGLIYTNLDTWTDPRTWPIGNFERPWLLDLVSSASRGMRIGGSHIVCMNATSTALNDIWWWWTPSSGPPPPADLLAGLEDEGKDDQTGYGIRAGGEWCVGAADAYYVPRRFFNDFAYLAGRLSRNGVPHGVALPTMMHIIDQNWNGGGTGSLIETVGPA